MIKKKKIILIFVLFFFIGGSSYLFSILINMAEKHSNVNFSILMKEINNDELYMFLTETSATEKIHFIVDRDENYYYIKYYSVPLVFFPIAKYKIQKKYLDIVGYKKNSLNRIRYSCIGNFKIKGYIEIGYYNNKRKKSCLNIN